MSLYYQIGKTIARIVCPKRTVVRAVADDGEPSIYVCNHSGLIGPVNMTLYYDKPSRPWIVSYVLDEKVNKNYIFHDFFFGRSKKCKCFWRGLAGVVAFLLKPLLVPSKPVIVHKNSIKVKDTFSSSVETLKEGEDLIVFAESHVKFSKFINKLETGFADIAKYYYKETGKCVKFYPVYVGNGLKTIDIGEPTEYKPDNNPKEERARISHYIQMQINSIAGSLPKHKPVPFVTEDFYQYYSEFVEDDNAYWHFVGCEYSE